MAFFSFFSLSILSVNSTNIRLVSIFWDVEEFFKTARYILYLHSPFVFRLKSKSPIIDVKPISDIPHTPFSSCKNAKNIRKERAPATIAN
jgi:hypothetical protein